MNFDNEQKLNPKLYDISIEQKTLREGFGAKLDFFVVMDL